jgi:hypothetical protein
VAFEPISLQYGLQTDDTDREGEKKQLLTTEVRRAESVPFFTTSGFWHLATWTQLA